MKFVFAFCLFLYSLQLYSRTIVITDIDDTLKMANSMGSVSSETIHFLLKRPYVSMRDLFNEIKTNAISKNEEIKFYYVSAAYRATFNPSLWIKKYNFPNGETHLRSLGERESTYDYKYKTITNIMKNELAAGKDLKVLFFGDNSSQDPKVYSDISANFNLNSLIYIRDVSTYATYFDSSLEVKKISGVNYFFSEVELFMNSEFNFLSQNLLKRNHDSYLKKNLIPSYTLKTLMKRLESNCSTGSFDQCHEDAYNDANKYWEDYHRRF